MEARNTAAYRKGRKAAAQYLRESFSYQMATGRPLPRPAAPYNGEALAAEWQAGFNSKAGAA